MRRSSRLGQLAGLCAVCALIATAAPLPVRAHTAAASYVITIGTDGPINTPLGVIVKGINQSVQLAAMLANQNHLVPNATFKMLPLDDSVGNNYSADKDAQNARTFIADPTVIGEIGPDNSGAAEVSMPIYNNASLTMVTPAATLALLTDPNNLPKFQPLTAAGKGPRTFFRTIYSDKRQCLAAARFAHEVLHAQTVYVTDNKDAYGMGLAEQFRLSAQKVGMKVLGYNELEPNQPLMGARALATVIKNTSGGNVDLVYFGGEVGSGGGAEFLAKALRQVGLTHTIFMGADGIFVDTYISAATPAVANGTYSTNNGYPPNATVPEPAVAKQFDTAFAKAFPGVALQGYNHQSYDAANVILQAFARAVKSGQFKLGATDSATVQANRAAVAQQVAATHSFAGTTGVFSFDSDGDTTSHTIISVYKVVNGKWAFQQYAPGFAP